MYVRGTCTTCLTSKVPPPPLNQNQQQTRPQHPHQPIGHRGPSLVLLPNLKPISHTLPTTLPTINRRIERLQNLPIGSVSKPKRQTVLFPRHVQFTKIPVRRSVVGPKQVMNVRAQTAPKGVQARMREATGRDFKRGTVFVSVNEFTVMNVTTDEIHMGTGWNMVLYQPHQPLPSQWKM